MDPPDPRPSEVSQLLVAAAGGDADARERVWTLVYAEIRSIAARQLARERDAGTLTPTALVHEAFLRLDGPAAGWQGRRHFFGAAAEAVRRILIDAARRRSGRGEAVALDADPGFEAADPLVADPAQLLLLDQALSGLAGRDPQMAEVFSLRAFAGLTVPEVAKLLEISPSSVDRRWREARAWLGSALQRMR